MKRLCLTICVLGLILSVAGTAAANTWQVVYQTDFSSDPGWITNTLQDCYWRPRDGVYHFKMTHTQDQYTYQEIRYQDGASYKLEFDIYLTRCDWAGYVQMVLGGRDMRGMLHNGGPHWSVIYHHVDQGRTASLVYRDDGGGWYHPYGNQPCLFDLGVWYHNEAIYDASSGTLSLKVTKRGDGAVVGMQNLTNVGSFSNINRLYMSVLGEDYSPGATAEGYIDNVVVLYTSPSNENNIIQNPSFETGDWSHWDHSGSGFLSQGHSQNTPNGWYSMQPWSGKWMIVWNTNAQDGQISQLFNVVPAGSQVSFWWSAVIYGCPDWTIFLKVRNAATLQWDVVGSINPRYGDKPWAPYIYQTTYPIKGVQVYAYMPEEWDPSFMCVDNVAVVPARWPPVVYYVDAVNGNDNNDGLTRRTAFATIHKGVDAAEDGFEVMVYPGVYQEEVDFKGKAITVQGVATKASIPVIENPGDFAVSFYNGEGPRSILKNFVVRNSFMAIFIAGSSPSIENLNIIGNKYGIEAYAGSQPDISNCIFWNNSDSDLFGCEARYSFVQQDIEPLPLRGLVAYWNFDEGSGTVAHDISGNNHNGTVYGATWVDGTSGKAMSFDGVDDYVMVPKGNAPTRGPYGTVAGWVKIASTFQCPSEGVGFISKMLHSTGMYQYEIGVYAGTSGPGHGCVGNGEGGCETCACVHWRDGQNIDPRLLFDDKWHHLSITWTPTVLTLYVDGIFENSVLHGRDLSIPDPMTWDLNIGRRAYSSAENWRYLQGHVDEVRIYNRALSIQEIQQLYRGQLGASPLFADAANGDYHLLSERGRYWPQHDVWVLDKVTSPCIDGGDPDDDIGREPTPNGGRIDMGAFGGTPFASMSEIKWLDGDINHDGVVNLIDLAMMAENWLRTGIGP